MMADEAVVVGGGPGGLRAAVALARAGRRVTLLQEGPFPGGHAHRDIPVGRGIGRAPGPLGEQIYGRFDAVDGLERGIRIDGKARLLPLHRSDLARLLPPLQAGSAAVAWSKTRGGVELRKIIGGGSELRTYRDWVVQRFGRPVFERFYADYCVRRFGAPDEVSCNIARLFHGTVPADVPMAPAAGPAFAYDGVDVRTDVAIRAVRGGQVETDEGLFPGEVFVDIAPRRVVEWLGDAVTPALLHDVGFLTSRSAIQVLVRGPQDLPFETHVLAGAPFFRVLRPGLLPGCGALADTLCVHYAVEASDPLWGADDDALAASAVDGLAAIGISGASAEGARVQRIRDHHPTWSGTHLVRMRRYVLALEELEIWPVGRAGLHAPLDLAAELGYLAPLVEAERPSVRDLVRTHVEPPVLDPPERTHLTRFVER
jgi:hypothetical protein